MENILSKSDEMRNWGNERLKPAALEDDTAAIAELKRRGNTLEDGQLVKVRKMRYVDNRGHEYFETLKVADGKLIERDGRPVGA